MLFFLLFLLPFVLFLEAEGVICVYTCACVCVLAAGKPNPVGASKELENRSLCVCVYARNIWADGIKFPSARFTPHGPLMSQHSACVCVDVCTCLIHIVGA